MRTLVRSLLMLTVLVAAALALHAGSAVAAKTIEVPVTMDWRIAQPSVSACTSWGLATWPEKKGATSWELRYHFSPGNPAAAGERTVSLSPPFDDEDFKQYGWEPGKGKHWHGLSRSGTFHFGGAPVSCDELQGRQKSTISNVRIAITLRPDATIAGVVKAPDGSPLRGVRVQAGARSARTGADGRYEIDVPEKERTYKVTASKARLRFKPRSRSVKVQPGRTSRANFRAQGHVIEVHVIRDCPAVASDDSDKQQCVPGVKGARATVTKVGRGRSWRVTTRQDGTVVIIVKEAGRYRIVGAHGGKTWRDYFRVRSDKVIIERNISSTMTGIYHR